jgi:hypothetical protein
MPSTLDAPLHFASRPGALRVRISRDDGLDRLSSPELHDLAVGRAKRHADAKFFHELMSMLPVAEAGAGRLAESEDEVFDPGAHLNDVRDAGRGEVAELLRPFYLQYLREHHVEAGR